MCRKKYIVNLFLGCRPIILFYLTYIAAELYLGILYENYKAYNEYFVVKIIITYHKVILNI